ncbi:hypothetical protein DL96DRAFT_1821835 [Flagelloscypha sp. PMI_526]|nr:hypothetical protein DL96DRAFT_1821835 [Flagelloscypha sp. PMI_526]
MATKLPTPALTAIAGRSVLKPVRNYPLIEVEKEVVEGLQQYSSTATLRSPFLEESWLRKEYKICATTLNNFEQVDDGRVLSEKEVQNLQKHKTDIRKVKELLELLLALPVQPLLKLPMDLLLEIIKWAALLNRPSWNLSLVSSQVQHWVDPILYAECTFFVPNRPASLFFNDVLSPRLHRCSNFVQSVTVAEDLSQEHLNALPRLFPNAKTLIFVDSYSTLIPMVHPSVIRLHCCPYKFYNDDPLRFSDQLFQQLTIISLDLYSCLAEELEPWDWSQLKSLTSLREFWITLNICYLSDENEYLAVLKNQVLPHLPMNLDLFTVYMDFEEWDDVPDNIWDTPDLRNLAAGLWDPRTVLLLSDNIGDQENWSIDQSVKVTFSISCSVERTLWKEETRAKLMDIVAQRRT